MVLTLWQEQVDWQRSLSPSEQNLLQAVDDSKSGVAQSSVPMDLSIPVEQSLYDTLKQKSHFSALRDALRLMLQSETRRDYEAYVSQQAEQTGHKALVVENLQQMSALSVANLYWYFQVRDQSEQAPAEESLSSM